MCLYRPLPRQFVGGMVYIVFYTVHLQLLDNDQFIGYGTTTHQRSCRNCSNVNSPHARLNRKYSLVYRLTHGQPAHCAHFYLPHRILLLLYCSIHILCGRPPHRFCTICEHALGRYDKASPGLYTDKLQNYSSHLAHMSSGSYHIEYLKGLKTNQSSVKILNPAVNSVQASRSADILVCAGTIKGLMYIEPTELYPNP
jgi:hypothetical protein